MRENVTFGECLAEILNALDLKSSRLAREINIDASLIYKWLRCERIPSSDSPYIELIMNYLSKKALNPHQKMNLTEVLTRHEIFLSGTSDKEMLDKLKSLLLDAQNNSINQRHQSKSASKLGAARPCTAGCDLKGKDDFTGSYDNVQIIKGNHNVIAAFFNLSKQAPGAPPGQNNTILITIGNDLKILSDTSGIYRRWIKKIYTLLSSGWKLILHIVLDDNVFRTIHIIENIQALLPTGNLSIYYSSKQSIDYCRGTELCIIPDTGALLCFSTNKKNLIDSAFLFRSKDSLELLANRFFHNLNSAKPLLKSCPPQKTSEFQQTFAEYEETPGDKFVFKGGLSTVTLPLDLYEKYLGLVRIHDPHFSYRAFLHRRRIEAFEEHVRHYSFKDVCFIESVMHLVDRKKYSFDEEYLFEEYTPQKIDIIRHLEYLVGLLEKYDNYNIAFVRRSLFEHLNDINWMVKDGSCVLIEIYNEIYFRDHSCPKINFSITEKSVVQAFHNYFNILWDEIPDENKNKENSIAWLKSLIVKCSEQR